MSTTSNPIWSTSAINAFFTGSRIRLIPCNKPFESVDSEKNTIETARETERGIVDIETVKKVNEDLISTIEETIKIQKDGRERRKLAEAELVQIEDKLKQTLLAHRWNIIK